MMKNSKLTRESWYMILTIFAPIVIVATYFATMIIWRPAEE
jgi:hypothetical protein